MSPLKKCKEMPKKGGGVKYMIVYLSISVCKPLPFEWSCTSRPQGRNSPTVVQVLTVGTLKYCCNLLAIGYEI